MKATLPLRWAVIGGLLGLLIGLISFAPASWLAQALATATANHVLLTDTRGTVWAGSGVLVLTGGDGSRDAASLPGRINWRTGLQGGGVRLIATQACCVNGELELLIKPGFGRMAIEVANRSDWLVRVPAGWLAGLGTPWNTLQLGGSLRLLSHDLRFERVEGRWLQQGSAQLDLVNLSSRVSTLAPLGSYRFSVTADAANAGTSLLQLSTIDGGLLLTGQGQLSANGKSRFQGEASAAPGREEALNNLLNIIGRRQGPRSILTFG
jgi:general secretion pathway protein N